MRSDSDEQSEKNPKPLFWIAGSRGDLWDFPDEVKAMMGFALYQAQMGSKHVAAKPLRGLGGAGVLEIVEDDKGSTLRGVYTVKFAGAIYVLDAFQKKSKKGAKTPLEDIDRIKKRLKAAEHQYQQWRVAQQKREDRK